MSQRIFLDTPSWYYSRRCTDWSMKIEMGRELSPESSPIVSNRIFVFFYNFQFAAKHFLHGRVQHWCDRLCCWVRAWTLERMHCDILISQGGVPPILRHGKVIWETYFLGPQFDNSSEMFCRGSGNYWIERVEEFGGRVAKIAVRGSASVKQLRRIFPEYADKVVDLGFIHREYAIVSEDYLRRKQTQKGVVQLLFIGRQARLKGLQPLIEACRILRTRGFDGFRLTIVSTLSDGPIIIPSDSWVRYIQEVQHDRAMELMRESQVFIMPTFYDSYGLVFHEAMASGCVTCVPCREPQQEFVDYGRAGMVVNPYMPEDIADKLQATLTSVELRVQLALEGNRRFRACYSQAVIREAWHRVINELEED